MIQPKINRVFQANAAARRASHLQAMATRNLVANHPLQPIGDAMNDNPADVMQKNSAKHLMQALESVRKGIPCQELDGFDDDYLNTVHDALTLIIGQAKTGLKLTQKERARRSHKKRPASATTKVTDEISTDEGDDALREMMEDEDEGRPEK